MSYFSAHLPVPNDKILFAKYSGTEFKMDGQEYLLLEASDVLAKYLN